MTTTDRMELLRKVIADFGEGGQAKVAQIIGKSDSCISQILSGTYKGSSDNVLQLVEEHFGGSTVICPILGEIPLKKCADNRRRPFAATNPLRVRLWRACKTCDQGGKK